MHRIAEHDMIEIADVGIDATYRIGNRAEIAPMIIGANSNWQPFR